ncbi:MAG: histidine kinase [Bryobacteraceae bacterium]|jgi:two-component system LytT family sensor kinase
MRQEYLIVLLLRLCVVASLASILVRVGRFKTMLLREERTINQRFVLALCFAAIFASGVMIRLVAPSYKAVDLGLEGSLVAGLVGGYVSGLISGCLISVPAMFGHELFTMPLLAGVGALGGLLRNYAAAPEEVWRFSPIIDLSVYRMFSRRHDRWRAAYQIVFLIAIVCAEALRQGLHHFYPRRLFAIWPDWPNPHPAAIIATYVTTLFAVSLPLKIWSNARNELQLEEQRRLLLQARMDALSHQINPHFLFNTLNSVSSLIRTNPQQARAVVYKLSNILRRLLRKHENFTSLGEELEFISDYLSIEVIRFGEKLRFEKDADPATLDRLVPSMLLQPLIENSVKHGLSSKVDGGMVRFRSSLKDGRLHLLVEDDGVGIPEVKLATLREQGIGVSNVNERLKVLFGSDYKMWIDSKPGQGTRIEIEIPELQSNLVAAP